MSFSVHTKIWVAVTMLLASLSLPAAVRAQEATNEISATMTLDRQRLYVHETTLLTLTITSRGVQLSRDLRIEGLGSNEQLTFGNFREFPIARSRAGSDTVEIRRFQSEIRAAAPGRVILQPALRTGIMRHRQLVFGNVWDEEVRLVSIPPVTCDILPIPTDGRPPDYSGAVGRFNIAMTATPTEVVLEDLIHLRFDIRGVGYLGETFRPELAGSSGFRVYPSKVAASASGALMTFTQVVIPVTTNATRLMPVRMVYFDPIDGAFRTAESQPVALTFRTETLPLTPGTTPPDVVTPAATPTPAAVVATQAGVRLPLRRLRMAIAGLQVACVVLGLAGGLYFGLRVYGAVRHHAPWRRLLRPALAVSIALLSGVMAWRLDQRMASGLPDARLRQTTLVRFTPSTRSPFGVPLGEGTAVRIDERWGAWVRIRASEAQGWVPEEDLTPLVPANP